MSYDNEQEKVQYRCINAGHTVGSRTFLKAPPEWFLAQGKDLPKNCNPCKAWRNSQVSEKLQCSSCRRMHLVTAGEKRRIHRQDGPYTPPTLCKDCVENPRPASANNFPQRAVKRQEKQEDKEVKFSDLPKGTINSLSIGTDKSAYQFLVPRKPMAATTKRWAQEAAQNKMSFAEYKQRLIDTGQWSDWETREEHLQRHVYASAEHDVDRSPSVIAPQSGSFEHTIAAISDACRSTDTNMVRQYTDGKGDIIRLTFVGNHDGLEKTILRVTDGCLKVVTSHDELTSAKAHQLTTDKVWK